MSVEKYVEAATKAFQKRNFIEGLTQLAKLDSLNTVPDPYPKPHESWPEPAVVPSVASKIIEDHYSWFEPHHFEQFLDSLTPLNNKEDIRGVSFLSQAFQDAGTIGPEINQSILQSFFKALVRTDQDKVRQGIEAGLAGDLQNENPKAVDTFVRFLEEQITEATSSEGTTTSPSKNQPKSPLN